MNKHYNYGVVVCHGPISFQVSILDSLPLNFSNFEKWKSNIFENVGIHFKESLKTFVAPILKVLVFPSHINLLVVNIYISSYISKKVHEQDATKKNHLRRRRQLLTLIENIFQNFIYNKSDCFSKTLYWNHKAESSMVNWFIYWHKC